MKILIIDYKAGNIQSVINAIAATSPESNVVVSNKIQDLRDADKIILPGVGAFNDCMDGINKVQGLAEEIRYQSRVVKKPFLGICVGMQVLASEGFENGSCKGLNLIEGEVRKIDLKENVNNLKIPQMGWNSLEIKKPHPILRGIKEGQDFYFANSYHFICYNSSLVLAQVDYSFKMNAILARENIFAIQFHPEKSGESGLRVINNFLNLTNDQCS